MPLKPSSTYRSRKLHGWAAFAASILAMLAIGLAAGLGGAALDPLSGSLGLAAIVGVNLTAMALAMVIFVWWWRGIDEAAREAHKWAWWWGGSIGLALGGAIMLTVVLRGDILATAAPARAFIFGIFILMMCQLAGYGVGWVAWWLHRR